MANQPKKYKKFVATAATATLVASAIVPVASAASFSDTTGNTHEAAISALSDAGIIKGYADGTFKPGKDLTRSDVVKLLGKYLETKGFEIPADWNSVERFSDVNLKNEELAKYAALVADAGVFSGNQGKLQPANPILREQMAQVLVRMVNTLEDVSLEEFVATQDFTKEVKDINAAKAEARSAIDVLDFYDITTVANFLPKNTVTRGQFATFLNNVINADFSAASATSGTVKVINNTTVEVTFGENIDDIKALKFAIEGLEVKDAVVKQTDKKTAVITTSAQEAGKEYTVTEGGKTIGKFTGISAVIPTGVNFETYTEASKQGVIGKEVTLKASVTVAEGQSKAGIPVTFNIISSNTANEKKEVEVKTEENGVASYTYTQYYAGEDTVVAYATSKSSIFANAKVYWANSVQLAVTEITAGNDLANETKKSYKINGARNAEYYVAIKENIQTTPDKLTNVKVQNAGTFLNGNLVNLGTFEIPYEFTTGATKYVKVTTNANGEGSFTIYGSNLSATPVVYASTTGKYSATALQASAPTVKFAQVDTLAFTVAAEGTAKSAKAAPRDAAGDKLTLEGIATTTPSLGGRSYSVTVTDKQGKLAPEGTLAYVTFEAGNVSDTTAGTVVTSDIFVSTTEGKFTRADVNKVVPVVVGKNGKASFRVISESGDLKSFVKPTVFLNTAGNPGSKANPLGTSANPVALDKGDIQQVGEVTYFHTAEVVNSVLTVTNKDGVVISALNAGTDATFTYQSVDQNGFAYRPATVVSGQEYKVWVPVYKADGVTVDYYKEELRRSDSNESNIYTLAFDVTSVFGDVTVKGESGTVLPAVQNLGNTKTYYVNSNKEGKAVIQITSEFETNVTVNVTGASHILPTKSASVEFLNSKVVPDRYTGIVTGFESGKLTFKDKNTVSAVGSNYKYFIQTNNSEPTELTYNEFSGFVSSAIGSIVVNRVVTTEGTTFTITSITLGGGTNQITTLVNAANTAVTAIPAITAETDLVKAKEAVTAAKEAIVKAEQAGATEAQLADAKAAVAKAEAAIKALEETTNPETVTVTVNEAITAGNFEVVGTGVIGTIAAGEAGKAVITLAEGKAFPTAEFTAKIGEKEYTATKSGDVWTLAPKAVVPTPEPGEDTVTLKDLEVVYNPNALTLKTSILLEVAQLPEDLVGKQLSVELNGKEVTFEPNSRNTILKIEVATSDFNEETFNALVVTAK